MQLYAVYDVRYVHTVYNIAVCFFFNLYLDQNPTTLDDRSILSSDSGCNFQFFFGPNKQKEPTKMKDLRKTERFGSLDQKEHSDYEVE